MSKPTSSLLHNTEALVHVASATSTTTTDESIEIAVGSTSNKKNVWLVIEELQSHNYSVTGTERHQENARGILINTRLEELRDALVKHLPASKEETLRVPSTTSSTTCSSQQVTIIPPPSPEQPPVVRGDAAILVPEKPIHQRQPALTPKSPYYPANLDEVKRFELFLRVIEHEDDLLNQRVSWIILAQSFLMAAFITAGSSSEHNSNALRYVTATVGLATVIVTLPAILAAGRNIEIQRWVYFNGLESDAQCQALHGHSRDIIYQQPNAEETTRRATRGHIFPNTAFRGKRSVPILNTVVALCVVQFAGWSFLLLALIMDW